MSAEKAKAGPKAEADGQGAKSKPFCGIVMPIASMPGYESAHWLRVRAVLDRAIADAGYLPRMVSESEDIGIIHAHIVQNLYNDEIVVCDVSAKNANVMFELGLRLAFDKPTVIVKDDETEYSFDTSPIKHIPYRKDQRFDDVEKFQADVTNAIKATVSAKNTQEDYSPFLGYFGKLTPKSVESKEVSQAEFIVSKLDQIGAQLDRMASSERAKTITLGTYGQGASQLRSFTKADLDWESQRRTKNADAAINLIDLEISALAGEGGQIDASWKKMTAAKVIGALVSRGTILSSDVVEDLIQERWDIKH